jgi:putative transposase
MTVDPAEAVALRRYALIAEAANPRLTPRERGRLVREVAARVHEDLDGSDWVVSRGTLDRWLRAYQTHGLEGLKPRPRADAGVVRRHPELFQEAAALRREHPARSAAHIADILHARHGIQLSERTVREQLHKRGLDRARLTTESRTFGRYEASRPNERWIGDVLVGPWVPHPRRAGSRQARLFLLVAQYGENDRCVRLKATGLSGQCDRGREATTPRRCSVVGGGGRRRPSPSRAKLTSPPRLW